MSVNPRGQGVATAELARSLAELVKQVGADSKLQVVCSHRGRYRDAEERQLTDAGVRLAQIALYADESHDRVSRIGIADIAICDKAGASARARLLIEVEENRSGVPPKLVYGDALLPALARRVDIIPERGRPPERLTIAGAEIWVGFHRRVTDVGARTARMEAHLNEVFKRLCDPEVAAMRVRLFDRPQEELASTMVAAAAEWLSETLSD